MEGVGGAASKGVDNSPVPCHSSSSLSSVTMVTAPQDHIRCVRVRWIYSEEWESTGAVLIAFQLKLSRVFLFFSFFKTALEGMVCLFWNHFPHLAIMEKLTLVCTENMTLVPAAFSVA